MTDIMVVNNEAGHRYEVWLGEALAGFAQYTLDDGLIGDLGWKPCPLGQGGSLA